MALTQQVISPWLMRAFFSQPFIHSLIVMIEMMIDDRDDRDDDDDDDDERSEIRKLISKSTDKLL